MSIMSWLRRRRLDDEDFQDEIRAHLEIAAAERMADGADRRTAQLGSLKDFGNVALTTEAARRVWSPWWVDAIHDQLSDVRYAIRALAKNPAFSLTLVAVLALGTGLNAAVFTMLKAIAFSPIAGVEQSSRLVSIFRETTSGRDVAVSYPDYQYLRDHDRAFSGLLVQTLRPLASAGAAVPPRSGPKSSPEIIFRFSACAPSAAACSSRRMRSRPAVIRLSCSATVCGDAISTPIRRLSARRSRLTVTR